MKSVVLVLVAICSVGAVPNSKDEANRPKRPFKPQFGGLPGERTEKGFAFKKSGVYKAKDGEPFDSINMYPENIRERMREWKESRKKEMMEEIEKAKKDKPEEL